MLPVDKIEAPLRTAALTLWGSLPSVQKLWVERELKVKKQKEAQAKAVVEASSAEEAQPAALPPVPAVSAEDVQSTSVDAAEVRKLFACLHHASYANSLPEDSLRAAAEVGLPADGVEMSYDTFVEVLKDYLYDKWADPLCLDYKTKARAESATGTNRPTDESRPPSTHSSSENHPVYVLEKYTSDMVSCVVDDQGSRPLLPIEKVLVRRHYPLSMEFPIAKFGKIVPHPEHDVVFDTIWEALGAKKNDYLTKDQFKSFFTLFHSYLFRNTSEERSAAASRHVWYDSVAASAKMGINEFISACNLISLMYAKCDDTVRLLRELLRAAGIPSLDKRASLEVRLPATVKHRHGAAILSDPLEFYIHNDLIESSYEAKYFETCTANRILVTGPEGVGRSALAKSLSKRLNAVFLDTETIAIEAADDKRSEKGEKIRQFVEKKEPIPIAFQAELLKSCLKRPETVHRGYVCGDVPPLDRSDESFLEQIGLADFPPQAFVSVRCPTENLSARQRREVEKEEEAYDRELGLREAEESFLRGLAERKRERDERALRNEALRAKKEAIGAKNGDLTQEEQAILDEEEEEEPEEPAALDEDGDELSAEETAAIAEAKRISSERRRFLAELRHLITLGRREGFCVGLARGVDPIECAALSSAREICEGRRRVVEVGCSTDWDETAEYVAKRLALLTSSVPTPPALPAEASDELGLLPDTGSPEYEAAYGRAVSAAVEEHPEAYQWTAWGMNCPVTFAEDGVLVEGAPEYSASYRGKLYYLASRPKLKRFTDAPHPYLRNKLHPTGPAILFRSKLDALGTEPGTSSTPPVVRGLSSSLKLTPLTLSEYFKQWEDQRHEVETRAEALGKRMEYDKKARKDAEDRARKRAEAEAKARRKRKEGKTKKSAKISNTVEEFYEEENVPKEEPRGEEEETSSDRIQAIIDEKKKLATYKFLPQLVVALDGEFEPGHLEKLFEWRVLPPTVVILDSISPKVVAEDEEVDGAEDEEPREYEDEEDEEDEKGEPEYDEEGNIIKKDEPKVDISDPKQYKRFMKNFFKKLADSAENAESEPEKGAVVGEEVPPGQSFPPQRFKLHRLNAFGLSAQRLVSQVSLCLSPSALRPDFIGDGDELMTDPPLSELREELGDRWIDRLLIPGKRADHQFGVTRRYCPVTLCEENSLVVGDPDFCLVYNYQKYLFAGQRQLNKFRLDPLRYLELTPPRGIIPPPRICVLGAKASGKKTLASKLRDGYNIPIFEAFDYSYFDELLNAATSPAGAEVRGLFVPAQNSPKLGRALRLREELLNFSKVQDDKMRLKEKTEKEKEEREHLLEIGDPDVDELDEDEVEKEEELLSFEPEEEEVRAERLALAHRRIGSLLTHIEPFESKGYVLCSYPDTEESLEVMLKSGAFCDVVLYLDISSEQYVERLIAQEVKKRRTEPVGAATEKKNQQMLKAREEALSKWRVRHIGAEREEQKSEEEEEEEEAGEEPETVDLESVKADLENTYGEEKERITTLLDLLPTKNIPVSVVNADQGSLTVYEKVLVALRPFLDCRRSIFEAPYVLRYKEALSLIQSGSKNLSYFRLDDPVMLYEKRYNPDFVRTYKENKSPFYHHQPENFEEATNFNKGRKNEFLKNAEDNENGKDNTEENQDKVSSETEDEEVENETKEQFGEEVPELEEEEIEEMRAELEAAAEAGRENLYPKVAILRNHAYFFENNVNLLRFLHNPLKFWDQPPPPPSVISVTNVSEFDNPEKRPMASHLALTMNSVFISIPKLFKWMLLHLEDFPGAATSGDLIHYIIMGKEIPSNYIIMVLAARLRCADVLDKGAILYNVLRDASFYFLLLREGLEITLNLCFKDYSDGITNAIDQRIKISHLIKDKPWAVSGLVEAVERISAAREAQQNLYVRRNIAFPSPIYHALITEEHIAANVRFEFKMYCPFMWSKRGQLVEVGSDRRFNAEYLDNYYCFSDKAYLDEFLVYPENFKPCSEVELPAVLPREIDESTARGHEVEFYGCCPVTLYDTRNNIGLKGVIEPVAVKGSYYIEYDNKYYAILNEGSVQRFLRQPWLFVDNAILPTKEKLPKDKSVIKSMRDENYIRHTIYEPVAKAMIAVSEVRPKFPGLTPEESARKFIALYLKANNEDCSELLKEQYVKNYNEYLERAVLYKTLWKSVPPSDPVKLECYNEACFKWDGVQDDPTLYKKYGMLPINEK